MSEASKIHTPPEGTGERRKVDPQRTVLPLEAHGARALDRFVGSDAPEDFDKTPEKKFTEGKPMQDILAGFLENRELRGPIDISKFVDKNYETAKALTVLRDGDKSYPSAEDVKKTLSENTPEQMEVINRMQKPVLQLLPITSGNQYTESLNGNKPMGGQVNAYVSPWTKGVLKRADVRDGVSEDNDMIIGWNVAITEGTNAPELLEGDDVSKTLEERCTWFDETYGAKGVSGTDLKRYQKLQQAGFAKETPRPIDDWFGEDKTWTMLNGEIYDHYVAGGRWDRGGRRVDLGERNVGGQYDSARFRVSVMRRCA